MCWRLIPYWLNNWEQQWGAECSSMMFELPHFAIELLVVLPCVQVHHIFPQYLLHCSVPTQQETFAYYFQWQDDGAHRIDIKTQPNINIIPPSSPH